MALFTLFIDQKPKQTQISRTVMQNGKGVTTILTLDAQMKETFKSECEPTTFPIENGSPGTDHVILKPSTLTLEGIVTETPITIGSSLAGIFSTVGAQVGAALGSVLPGVSATGGGALVAAAGSVGASYATKSIAGLLDPRAPNSGQAVSGFNRVTDTIKELQYTRDARLPITIVTGLNSYPPKNPINATTGQIVDGYILKSFSVERNKTTGRSIQVALELQEFISVVPQVGRAIPATPSGKGKNKRGTKNGTQLTKDQQASGTAAFELLKLGKNVITGGG